jgi:hypothetical protein
MGRSWEENGLMGIKAKNEISEAKGDNFWHN